MNRSTLVLVHALVTTLFVGLAGHIHASYVLPSGLSPGDQYRLVFVTSGARDASSANIEDYNDFVKSYGDQAVVSNWKAIVSTATVDARDNTSSNPTTDGVGVPIYNLMGELVADDYSDLWGGELKLPIKYNEEGTELFSWVWTGTSSDGTALSDGVGSPSTTSSRGSSLGDAAWSLKNNNNPLSVLDSFYGMSTVQTVEPEAVPEPASVITWTLLGIVGYIGTLWNRRRKAG